MRVTLVILQLFGWLFALTFIAMGALVVAGIDLLLVLELGKKAGLALHLAVVAVALARLQRRRSPGLIAI